MKPAEIIGAVYRLNGSFEIRGDELIVTGIANLPADVRLAIDRHKPTLHRLISAYGGQWPAKPEIK